MAKKVKKERPLESVIENHLVRECLARNWEAWKLTSPNRKGVPDRLILADFGVTVMVECKRPGGKLSSLQSRTIARLQEKGHLMYVVSTVDEVDDTIRRIESRVSANAV